MESVDLLDGSFKGIDFYVKDDEGLTTFGRKLAIQEYPNTSEQFAEDVGGFARNFNLTIFWTRSLHFYFSNPHNVHGVM
jgi:prophage DNA circulation protein